MGVVVFTKVLGLANMQILPLTFRSDVPLLPQFFVFWDRDILVDYKNKIHQKGDPYKMSNINVVQSCWNFAQLTKIKE